MPVEGKDLRKLVGMNVEITLDDGTVIKGEAHGFTGEPSLVVRAADGAGIHVVGASCVRSGTGTTRFAERVDSDA